MHQLAAIVSVLASEVQPRSKFAEAAYHMQSGRALVRQPLGYFHDPIAAHSTEDRAVFVKAAGG